MEKEYIEINSNFSSCTLTCVKVTNSEDLKEAIIYIQEQVPTDEIA